MEDYWYKIRTFGNHIGWIYGNYINIDSRVAFRIFNAFQESDIGFISKYLPEQVDFNHSYYGTKTINRSEISNMIQRIMLQKEHRQYDRIFMDEENLIGFQIGDYTIYLNRKKNAFCLNIIEYHDDP